MFIAAGRHPRRMRTNHEQAATVIRTINRAAASAPADCEGSMDGYRSSQTTA